MTIGEANAVNIIWRSMGHGERYGCDEWIAFRLLARAAYKALSAGVTEMDVTRRALKFRCDISPEPRGKRGVAS